MAPVSMTLSDP